MNKLDQYLSGHGLARKHVPRGSNSLFRCISEIEYFTQLLFLKAKKQVIDYVISLDKPVHVSAIEQLMAETKFPDEDIYRIVSSVFDRTVIIYEESSHGHQQKAYGTQLVLRDKDPILLAHCIINGMSHFDLIITQTRLRFQAVAQSLVYKILLTSVFGQNEQDITAGIEKMMTERHFAKLKIKRKRYSRGLLPDQVMPSQIMALPPFPYKIAKALDMTFYRNVMFDLWLSTIESPVKNGSQKGIIERRRLLPLTNITVRNERSCPTESISSSTSTSTPNSASSFMGIPFVMPFSPVAPYPPLMSYAPFNGGDQYTMPFFPGYPFMIPYQAISQGWKSSYISFQ